MKSLGFIGKLLYAGPMAMFAIGHFTNADAMSGMVPSFLPAPIFWVYLTGLCLLLAAIAIVIGKKAKLATQLLGLMLIAFAVLLHMSGFLDGDQVSTAMFMKDMALGGAAWFMSAHLKN